MLSFPCLQLPSDSYVFLLSNVISRPSMSGLISSLLVEPIVRQARRLSHQTTSSSTSSENDQLVSQHTQQISTLSNNNGRKDAASVFSEGLSTLSHDSRCANPANDSTISPPLSFDLRSQCQENQCCLQPGQTRYEHKDDDNLSENPTQNTIASVGNVNSGSRLPEESSTIAHDSVTTSRTQESVTALGNAFEMDEIGGHSALPEDDGMGILRRRIHTIRGLDISSTEKARMVHDLMTEKYNASRGSITSHSLPIGLSSRNLEHPTPPTSPTSRGSEISLDRFPIAPASSASIFQQRNPYNLTREDLEPTFCPKIESDLMGDGEDMETEELEELCLGCEHYKRNVKLQCYACRKWYPCRFCHDEVEDHHLNRRKTENMLCMLCGHAQPASQWCKQCGEQTAQYYCNVCKLWDNDSKKNIYHCGDCGICRVGQGLGKDFFHCRVSISTQHPSTDAKP